MHSSLWKSLAAALPLDSASIFAQVDFSHTITLGSVLLGVLVLVAAGIFTIRSQVVSVWRQEAEGSRERIKTLELAAKEAERDHIAELAALEREQQELRHNLKDKLAACKAELTVEQAKHDLGSIVEQMNKLHHDAMHAMLGAAGEHSATMSAALLELGGKVEAGQVEIRAGQQQTLGILTEIRDALAPGSS